MPVADQVSSTRSSLECAAYVPTDEAHTNAGTSRSATARAIRVVPMTLVRRIAASSRDGWICHASWTTTSAPSITARLSEAMSHACHDSRGSLVNGGAGTPRATPTNDVTSGRDDSARMSALPTLPGAPKTTTFTTD